jgi:hypothetical protein
MLAYFKHIAGRRTIAPVDPTAGNVTALLHMEGVVGSKVTTDDVGHAVSINGNAVVLSNQKKFGNTSVYFPGFTTDFIALPDSDDFAFRTGPFTVEMFARRDGANASVAGLFYQRNSCKFLIAIQSQFYVGFWNGSWVVSDPNPTFVDATWIHVALTRDSSNILRLFVGGKKVASATDTTDYVRNNSTTTIGSDGNKGFNQAFKGWIDELRVKKGVAEYTADFVPPPAPFSLV